jgi:hypothetical protein
MLANAFRQSMRSSAGPVDVLEQSAQWGLSGRRDELEQQAALGFTSL